MQCSGGPRDQTSAKRRDGQVLLSIISISGRTDGRTYAQKKERYYLMYRLPIVAIMKTVYSICRADLNDGGSNF